MNNKELAEKISKALCELKLASIGASGSSIRLEEIIHKYDMIFIGEKGNVIDAIHLQHTLKHYFEVDITREQLNSLLPTICSNLGMTIEVLIAVDDILNPTPEPYTYLVTLGE